MEMVILVVKDKQYMNGTTFYDLCYEDCLKRHEEPVKIGENFTNFDSISKVVAYTDYGIDRNSENLINHYSNMGLKVEIRSLN